MTTITPAYNVQQIEAFQFRGAASESAMQTAGASVNAALYGLDTSGTLVGSVPSGIYAINSLVNSTSAVYGLNGGLAAMLGTTFNPTTNPTTGTVSAQLANTNSNLTTLTGRVNNAKNIVVAYDNSATPIKFADQSWATNPGLIIMRYDTPNFVVSCLNGSGLSPYVGTNFDTGIPQGTNQFYNFYFAATSSNLFLVIRIWRYLAV